MQKSTLFALLLLVVMGVLMIGSVREDASTSDEPAHISAGFAHVTRQDYRFNPEHPPLLKAISAFFANLVVRPLYPSDTPDWQNEFTDKWAQWRQGGTFLYQSGNNADQIIFWSRVPMIGITLLFGWIFFWWIRKRYGALPAILALILFVFSPTLLAHGRLVTTDVGAAFGFFAGIITFIHFLEHPTWKNVLLAGLVFGLVQLLKFSLLLLIPLYGIMLLTWVLARYRDPERRRLLGQLLTKTFSIGLIGLAVIWSSYAVFTFHYPLERNLRDNQTMLQLHDFPAYAYLDLALIQHPITRPIGQYVFGVMLAHNRIAWGNSVFFLGNYTREAQPLYFPVLYLLKEPLAFHILTLLALYYNIRRTEQKQVQENVLTRVTSWVRHHFTEFSFAAFLVLYWVSSLLSPLNIGIRHILPVIPITYLLVALGLAKWLSDKKQDGTLSGAQKIKNLFTNPIRKASSLVTITLLVWLVSATLLISPFYLSYYNELAGGAKNGYQIAVDSNYDWGQDLKRLQHFVEEQRIEKIAVHYFGGGDPAYYLGNTAEPWWSARGPAHGWFAISLTERQKAFAQITELPPEDRYDWLKVHQPVATVGYSILVYQLP